MSTRCEVTGCHHAATVRVRALRWDEGTLKRGRGDRLCDECHTHLKVKLSDHIPHPQVTQTRAPAGAASRSLAGKPAAYVVARASQQSLIERDTAITLAFCFGRLREAVALKETLPHDKLVYVTRWLQPAWLNRNTSLHDFTH
jgi:hypothetical protein